MCCFIVGLLLLDVRFEMNLEIDDAVWRNDIELVNVCGLLAGF